MQKRGENELNINEQITAQQVRLVGENIPEPGVYPIAKALQLADELELDLVEISASADPPVCKILDYQKYLYQKKKKAKEMKSNAAKVVIKEIRFLHLFPRPLHNVQGPGRETAAQVRGGAGGVRTS